MSLLERISLGDEEAGEELLLLEANTMEKLGELKITLGALLAHVGLGVRSVYVNRSGDIVSTLYSIPIPTERLLENENKLDSGNSQKKDGDA